MEISSIVSGKISHTVRGAAQATGISKSKIWELIKNGELSSVKVAGRRLIPDEALRELVNPK